MYNLMAKNNIRTMMFQGRMIKGIVSGAVIGLLSFIFLFSNHPIYALVVAIAVIAFLCFAPEKKKNGNSNEQLFIYPETGQFCVLPDVPEYSLKEIKQITQEALFEKVGEKAVAEAETGHTGFIIWNIDSRGVQSKVCITKKMPGQNLGAPEIRLRSVLNKVFG